MELVAAVPAPEALFVEDSVVLAHGTVGKAFDDAIALNALNAFTLHFLRVFLRVFGYFSFGNAKSVGLCKYRLSFVRVYGVYAAGKADTGWNLVVITTTT